MGEQEQATQSGQQKEERAREAAAAGSATSSGDQLVDELGRLGRKFVELLETAWNSDQRRQIEQDVRKGLADVSASLETGLRDLSEKEKTKEFVGKAETVADNVGEKVRTSEIANELARGLTSGLAALANELDRLNREMRASQAAAATKSSDVAKEGDGSQDIPITNEDNKA